MRFKKLLTFSAIMAALSVQHSAHAFKVDTHAWVGQEIANDLKDDGKLTLYIDGIAHYYSLDEPVYKAITEQTRDWLSGNVGPDGYPDIYSGQMAIHPGSAERPDDWATNDYLNYLMTETAKYTSRWRNYARADRANAFTYGFLAHSAVDVFAHSYVNEYAGDAFSLSDGESLVELRHIGLESYISRLTPPLQDHQGNLIGNGDFESLNLVAPTEFIFDTLMVNPELESEYEKNAPHLAAISRLYNMPNDKMVKLAELAKAAQSVVDDIMKANIEIMKAVYGASTFDIFGMAILNGISEYSDQEILNKLNDYKTLVSQSGVDVAIQLSDSLATVTNEYFDLKEQFISAELELAQAIDNVAEIGHICTYIDVLNPQWIDCDFDCHWTNPSCYVHELECEAFRTTLQATHYVTEQVCEATDQLPGLEDLVKVKQDVFNVMSGTVRSFQENHSERMSDIGEVVNEALFWENQWTKNATKIPNIRFDIQKMVKKLMMDYIDATTEVIALSTDPSADDPLQPYKEWLECAPFVLTGFDDWTLDKACEIHNLLTDLHEHALTHLGYIAKVDPVLKEMIDLYQDILEDIEGYMMDEALKELEKMGINDAEEIFHALTNGVDDSTLQYYFSEEKTLEAMNSDGSSKGLIAINNIISRIDNDLSPSIQTFGGIQKRVFDKNSPLIFNALQLAKMSLMSHTQLNQVVQDAGLTGNTIYGPTLFDNTPYGNNILSGSIRSIDGNQQWKGTGQPYPRVLGTVDPSYPQDHKYGYKPNIATSLICGFTGWIFKCEYKHESVEGLGFRLWQDDNARALVFNKIFKGPVAEALYMPPVVIPYDYPYISCAENPFPAHANAGLCNQ